MKYVLKYKKTVIAVLGAIAIFAAAPVSVPVIAVQAIAIVSTLGDTTAVAP